MIMNIINNTFQPHSLLRNMNIFRSTYIQLLMFSILIPSIRTATFKYNPGSQTDMKSQGNTSFMNDGIQLSTNGVYNSTGRALYAKPVRLWDSATGDVANFSTRFSFLIKVEKGKEDVRGDGLAFFLAPNGSTIPPVSNGSLLGLFNGSVMFNSAQNPAVAVEFDTYHNADFDPYDSSSCHVGIDINSIKSNNTAKYECSLFLHNQTDALISYDSSTKYLSIHVSPGNVFLTYPVDLKDKLGEWVNVGFTAATGGGSETHKILSWEFNWTELEPEPEQKTNTTKLVIGLAVSLPLFIVVGAVMILFMWRKNGGQEITLELTPDEEYELKVLTPDEEYELKGGPTKYSYRELVCATDDFKDERKLGEGSSGKVYRGTLSDSNKEVAVKKISKEFKQGKKEFISEVTSIGKLAHRNLVRLLGWCHEQGVFFLVYEYLSNHSLHFHLFGGERVLIWKERYEIAKGLASALLYLHEGWDKCVVHRDIKSRNILLDSDFNAKLGDFGLARFADLAEVLKTTMPGGTFGYMAPEYARTGKPSKESDIYSFGVVVLEITCGRKAVLERGEDKVHLATWVLELFASRNLLEAADMKLGMDIDERQQMERLMLIGLWCAAEDFRKRPSIKQVVSLLLNMEAPLPDLFTHLMPSMQNYGFCPASSSSVATDNQSRTSGVRVRWEHVTGIGILAQMAASTKPFDQFCPSLNVLINSGLFIGILAQMAASTKPHAYLFDATRTKGIEYQVFG